MFSVFTVVDNHKAVHSDCLAGLSDGIFYES